MHEYAAINERIVSLFEFTAQQFAKRRRIGELIKRIERRDVAGKEKI